MERNSEEFLKEVLREIGADSRLVIDVGVFFPAAGIGSGLDRCLE